MDRDRALMVTAQYMAGRPVRKKGRTINQRSSTVVSIRGWSVIEDYHVAVSVRMYQRHRARTLHAVHAAHFTIMQYIYI